MAAMLAAYRTGIEGKVHIPFGTEGEQSAYEKGLYEKYRPIMGDYIINMERVREEPSRLVEKNGYLAKAEEFSAYVQ